jgi:hypothetical protein
MSRTSGFKPLLRIMALLKRYSARAAFQVTSPVQKSAGANPGNLPGRRKNRAVFSV